MLYWCGKRKTNIELGAGVGEDFDLPDLTNTLDGLVVQLLRSHIQSANYSHSREK